ncbi:hypothetical protein KVV02_003977 [Mortierella alpina]|uniref:DUF605-domain-containing protein n=1 Tax=Mortierella alpina TaxID=64518 RepID=A0A9P8A235_MORAP|nr:hypothetical protein KVV02_003977 [Mortierella alpina]
MSVANVPEGLKSITPFLQRAAQLQDREPVVSYYSNHYALKLALPKVREANNRAFIEELFGVLEKQKKDIGDNEAISDDLVGYAHIENFALKIFKRADDEDRAGQASQKTAKNFVAAANFLELLKVFGDIDSDVEEKVKYAKWRAADIVKAIRDGRQPQPPPGAATDDSSASLDMGMSGIESSGDRLSSAGTSAFMPSAATVVPPNSAYLSSPINPMSPPTSNSAQYGYGINNTVDNNNLYQPPVVPAPAPVPSPYSQPGFNPPSAPYPQQPQQPPPPPAEMPYTPVAIVLDPAVNSQVVKHCKWTVSALTYDDVPTAIDNLEKALALLRPYHKK